jgi:archaellin
MDKITPPLKLLWVGQGKNPVALMRTSWTDRNAIYVGLKAGSPSVNHGHMDAGSFIMEADGERWAMDFGMQDYNSLETAGVNLWGMAQNSQRWEVYRYNNFVHNTLTVNDSLQAVHGYSVISAYSENPQIMNAVTDISYLYKDELKTAKRGIAIVDKKYVMIRDEIETLNAEAIVRWNLLTSANVAVIGNNVAEFTKNGKKLVLTVKSPIGAEIKTWSTVPPHSYDAPNPGTTLVGFEITIPPGSKEDLVVLMLPEGAVENTAITVKTLTDWPGKE